MAREYKYTDRSHPPVPLLKVGDICYATGGNWRRRVSTCEIRRVEVRWVEADRFFSDDVAHWSVDYYIRKDVDWPPLKSTIMSVHGLDDEHINRIYLTPQEAMEEVVRRFKETVCNQADDIRKEMRRLGYTKAESRKMLNYKV